MEHEKKEKLYKQRSFTSIWSNVSGITLKSFSTVTIFKMKWKTSSRNLYLENPIFLINPQTLNLDATSKVKSVYSLLKVSVNNQQTKERHILTVRIFTSSGSPDFRQFSRMGGTELPLRSLDMSQVTWLVVPFLVIHVQVKRLLL